MVILDIINITIAAVATVGLLIGDGLRTKAYKNALKSYQKALQPAGQVGKPEKAPLFTGIIIVPDLPRITSSAKIVQQHIDMSKAFMLQSDWVAFLVSPRTVPVKLLWYSHNGGWKYTEYNDVFNFKYTATELWDQEYFNYAQDENYAIRNKVRPHCYPIGVYPEDILEITKAACNSVGRLLAGADTNTENFYRYLRGVVYQLTSAMVYRNMKVYVPLRD